jgi:hypothetical protein
MKLTLQQAHHVLQAEIEWCLKHPNKDLTADHQLGFRNGLKQAQYLLEKAEEKIKKDG